jgi:hypothetical protein
MELEALQEELKTIESTRKQRIEKYTLEQEQESLNRKEVQHYLNQINDITKQLKVFENVEQQAEFKKSLLSKI